MESNLHSVMEAISRELPTKEQSTPDTKPKRHRCKLFVRNQGSSGTAIKAFTCIECAHNSFTYDELPTLKSNYIYSGDVSLDYYWTYLNLQLEEAELKLKKEKRQGIHCHLCDFNRNKDKTVLYL